MFDNIIAYSIRNKLVIGLLTLGLIAWGIFSLRQLPIDAIPDITNNQVQVITTSPTLATQEIEQFVTTPIELVLQNLQDVVEIRSVSKFGLSVVTVVFSEDMDVYLARQLVSEHLREAEDNIPKGFGTPTMAPISTGLGEIYQYIVKPEAGFEDRYSPTELRSIQDWIIRRQLAGIPGVVEINSLGGELKQYEVAVNPNKLKAMSVSMSAVFDALANSNENTGGSYIEKTPRTYYIRTSGLTASLADIAQIVVDVRGGKPILIKDVATVGYGAAPRYGAATSDGKEVVHGMVMMLKGANSAEVTGLIKERMIEVQKSLPEGVIVEPYLVRDKLISTAISTVQTNLIEGGLIVVFILVLLLGNWRAGLVVASVIPLAMLFAVSMMNLLGISANLMSLGAIDFGLIVDGAVIIVEAIIHRLNIGSAGKELSQTQMDCEVEAASIQIRSSAAFGEIIILMVYLPILALVGIEGMMFRPMAQTVMLAIAGALILSLTYVPMMTALVLKKNITNKRTIADKIIAFFQRLYEPVLAVALRFKAIIVLATIALFAVSLWTFSNMGGEFIPTLEEGDLALHQILPPGSSLSESIEVSYLIQEKLQAAFPEIEKIVTKIGAAEIPTDPMPVETGDIMVIMKPKEEWASAKTRQEMQEKMAEVMATIPGVASEYSQPIQMRFNELMTGSRADIAVKLYGEDLKVLARQAEKAEGIIRRLAGVGTINVEATEGMPQVLVKYDYAKLAQYGLQVKDVNKVVRMGFAGESAGTIYEGDRRFDLTVRLDKASRDDISDIRNLYLSLSDGSQVPLSAVASVDLIDAPLQISREDTKRRVVIGVNVGDSDVETLVGNIQSALDSEMNLPPGYFFRYGGQFENLKAATDRLLIAVPVALALIFILLYFTFGSFTQATLIFVAIPLSAIGGIWALELRGMPFSISAGIGFIALFGVAVLNGIVLIGYFNQLKKEGWTDVKARIEEGTRVRLRPVIMTASVASLGFLPMALSSSGGAEVQRPLATVVIGGLITATFLTLVVLPILYSWLERYQDGNPRSEKRDLRSRTLLILLLLIGSGSFAQPDLGLRQNPTPITLTQALEKAAATHPSLRAASLQVEALAGSQNLKYQPGRTHLGYETEGQFQPNSNRLSQFTLSQNLPHPAVVRAQNRLQDARVGSAKIEQALTGQELDFEVRQVYYLLQQRKSLMGVLAKAEQRYTEYKRIADVRVRVGSANPIEALTLANPLAMYQLRQRQTATEIAALENELALLTGSEEAVTITDTIALAALPTEEGLLLGTQLAERQRVEQEAQSEMLKARLKPSFNAGYAAQKFYQTDWLNAFQVGVELNVFRRNTTRILDAQKINVAAANERVATEQQRIAHQRINLASEIAMARQAVETYRQQLAVLNPELERVTQLNYEAGQIGYLDILNSLDLLISNQVALHEALLNHNLAVARYRLLLNL